MLAWIPLIRKTNVEAPERGICSICFYLLSICNIFLSVQRIFISAFFQVYTSLIIITIHVLYMPVFLLRHKQMVFIVIEPGLRSPSRQIQYAVHNRKTPQPVAVYEAADGRTERARLWIPAVSGRIMLPRNFLTATCRSTAGPRQKIKKCIMQETGWATDPITA